MDKLVLTGIGSAIAISGMMILFISSAGREDVQFIYKWLSGNIWGGQMGICPCKPSGRASFNGFSFRKGTHHEYIGP